MTQKLIIDCKKNEKELEDLNQEDVEQQEKDKKQEEKEEEKREKKKTDKSEALIRLEIEAQTNPIVADLLTLILP